MDKIYILKCYDEKGQIFFEGNYATIKGAERKGTEQIRIFLNKTFHGKARRIISLKDGTEIMNTLFA